MILTQHGIDSMVIPGGGGGSAIDDIGGRVYNTVVIGGVTWMAENLDYGSSGVYYNNDEATYGWNGLKYGKLYTWDEAVAAANAIPGWHVPSQSEWDALVTAVGGSSTAGTKLKSTTGWNAGNGDGSYGFEAFPAGYWYSGSFQGLGIIANFWTTNELSPTYAYYRYFNKNAVINSYNSPKTVAYSVRLVKDSQ